MLFKETRFIYHLQYSPYIPECDLLDAPLNGWLNFIATTNGIRWIGTVARFGCNVGYRLTNTSTSTRTCSSEFTWTGSTPNCVVDNTGSLKIVIVHDMNV